MSVQLQNPRTFQNRNRMVTRAQELIRGTHKSQQRELVAQQNLILMEQQRRIRQKRANKVKMTDQLLPTDELMGMDTTNQHTPINQHTPTNQYNPTNTPNQDQKDENGDTKILMNGFHDEKSTPEDTPKPNATQSNHPTIFVSIASYRDRECIATVTDLFMKAEHPNRVFIGVYEQNDPETDKAFTIAHLLENEPDKIPQLSEYYNNNQLRVMVHPCVEAKGPMYARALIEQHLFQQEQFYMIIDSHSLFEPHWDSICLNEWTKARKLSSRPILSYYPPNFDMNKRTTTPLQQNPNLKLDYMRLLKFDKNCGFPNPTKQAYINMPREPIRSLFWTACFSFAPSSMIELVPFDDGFPYLFLGEEICMNLRLYTHGYDVFGPTQHILYHIESREYRPTFWELFYTNLKPMNASFTVSDSDRDTRKTMQNASIQRMAKLLYNHPDHEIPDRFGLGHVRTYEQFCDFIGINFENKQAEQHTMLGRTKQPSKEEQYAKTVKNTALPAQNQSTQMQSLQQQSRMNGTGRNGTPKGTNWRGMNAMKPMPMQQTQQMQKQMKMMRGQPPNRMTKMTGLTGAGMMDPNKPTPQKQIPRTRTINQFRPQPRAYAPGMWGKA